MVGFPILFNFCHNQFLWQEDECFAEPLVFSVISWHGTFSGGKHFSISKGNLQFAKLVVVVILQ